MQIFINCTKYFFNANIFYLQYIFFFIANAFLNCYFNDPTRHIRSVWVLPETEIFVLMSKIMLKTTPFQSDSGRVPKQELG